MERHGWSIQSNVKSVSFSTNHWLVCIPSECQIANQCILETWSIRSICARIYCELGFVPISRISPVCSRGSVFAKIGGDGATGLLIDPTQTYFGSLLRIMVDQPLYFKATRTTLTTASVGELTYPLRVTLLVCRVSKIILSSWRKSTVKQYNVYFEKWSTFCYQDKVISCVTMFRYFWIFFMIYVPRATGYSSLNTARSAISALYSTDKTDVGQNTAKHPLISHFLEGCLMRSPRLRNFTKCGPWNKYLPI